LPGKHIKQTQWFYKTDKKEEIHQQDQR
jgi:hypothetical protein